MPEQPTVIDPAEKPGYLTTEFWLSVIPIVAILFKLIGVDLDHNDFEPLAASVAALLGGGLVIWGIVGRYIKGRSEVKAAQAIGRGIEGYAAMNNGTAPLTVTYGGK